MLYRYVQVVMVLIRSSSCLICEAIFCYMLYSFILVTIIETESALPLIHVSQQMMSTTTQAMG